MAARPDWTPHSFERRERPGDAGEALYPPDENARRLAGLILERHRGYLAEFIAITAGAKQTFENRDWNQAALNAEHRVRLYRDAVNGAWHDLERQVPERLRDRRSWMAARQAFLERVLHDYDADLALTFFYSTMRIAFDELDSPVEYADDGLAGNLPFRNPSPQWHSYGAGPEELSRGLEQLLRSCEFRAPFENAKRDAAVVAARLLEEWWRQVGAAPPEDLQMLEPLFFRDREAYMVGKLRSYCAELPVVLALAHNDSGITVDAVLAGTEDMRNILFVSTRSTFHVLTTAYREVLAFLDTLAPERGHPAIAAVIGFTHPARVALNQALRHHLRQTGERLAPAPGRKGTAMIVFSPPSFPYVFKVIRDYTSKEGGAGRGRIMELYRWVHEINRGRLMLDAWVYRNLHFPRQVFEEQVLTELLTSAPTSVRLDGDIVVLKHVYSQRRVQPLNTFFDETRDRALRERAIDGLGTFIKDLAAMGLFIGDHYGLPFNTGLTHAFNVALFDFDDLGSLLRHRFHETPPFKDEEDELLWNTEADGAWFSVSEFDVLVDEWERYLGVPLDLRDYFRQKHADLFSAEYWREVQQRVSAGQLHYVVPYPAERRLVK